MVCWADREDAKKRESQQPGAIPTYIFQMMHIGKRGYPGISCRKRVCISIGRIISDSSPSQGFPRFSPSMIRRRLPGGIDIEYDNRQIVFLAKGEGRHVHDTKSIPDDFGKSDLVNFNRVFVLLRIRSIDTIDACAFEDDFSIDFICPQSRCAIRGKIWIARACAEDDNTVLSPDGVWPCVVM